MGRVFVCVCMSTWPLRALSPQAEPFASSGRGEGWGGRVRWMLPYVFMCGVFICGCITYVGVKKCYIFTSCCLSLLTDAQQQCRMALAWPLSTAPLQRRALTYLGVREMFPSPHFSPPLTPFCKTPQTRHICHAQFHSFFSVFVSSPFCFLLQDFCFTCRLFGRGPGLGV